MRSDTASQPGTIHVTTSAAVVVPYCRGRSSLTIQNTSADATLFFGYGPGLTAANGMRVLPGQTFFEQDYTGAVWACASAVVDVPFVEVG